MILTDVGAIDDFTGDNASDYFDSKEKVIGQTRNNDTKDVEMMISLKDLGSFWRNLEAPLINCEINIVLT